MKNLFIELEKQKLRDIFREYELWSSTAVIPDKGDLAKYRDKYYDEYDVHCLTIMERDLLYAIAKRFLEE